MKLFAVIFDVLWKQYDGQTAWRNKTNMSTIQSGVDIIIQIQQKWLWFPITCLGIAP